MLQGAAANQRHRVDVVSAAEPLRLPGEPAQQGVRAAGVELLADAVGERSVGVLVQRLHEPLERMRVDRIVGVEDEDVFPAGVVDREVPGSRQPGVVRAGDHGGRQPGQLAEGLLHHAQRAVRRGVVDEHDLRLLTGGERDARERLLDGACVVVQGDDDGDLRGSVRPRAEVPEVDALVGIGEPGEPPLQPLLADHEPLDGRPDLAERVGLLEEAAPFRKRLASRRGGRPRAMRRQSADGPSSGVGNCLADRGHRLRERQLGLEELICLPPDRVLPVLELEQRRERSRHALGGHARKVLSRDEGPESSRVLAQYDAAVRGRLDEAQPFEVGGRAPVDVQQDLRRRQMPVLASALEEEAVLGRMRDGALDEAQRGSPVLQNAPAACNQLAAPRRVPAEKRHVDRATGALTVPVVPLGHVAERQPPGVDSVSSQRVDAGLVEIEVGQADPGVGI